MALSNDDFIVYPKAHDFQILPSFLLSELACPCIYLHCRATILYKPFLDLLQRIRDKIESPLIVTSGYRCSEKNRDLKGAPLSAHLMGAGADIKSRYLNTEEFVDICQKLGATGIGIYKDHLHIDLLYADGSPRRWTSVIMPLDSSN